MNIHRVREPGWPRDLDRFVALGGADERGHARGRRSARRRSTPTTWSTATTGSWRRAAAALADRLEVPYVTTIHATEHGTPSGLGRRAAAVAHPRRRALDGAPRGRGDRLLLLHARPRRRHLRHRRAAGRGDPQRRRPERTAPARRSAGAAARASPSPTRSSCCSSGVWSTRRASSWPSTRSRM